MSDDPKAFNPYQPTVDRFGSNDELDDPRFVAEHVREVARWQTIVAVFVSLAACVFAISMLVRALGSGDPASFIIGTLLCPLALIVIVFIIPAVELWKSVGAARQFGKSESGGDYAAFAASQRSLWRTLAIVAILLFAFFALIAAVAGLADFVAVDVGN